MPMSAVSMWGLVHHMISNAIIKDCVDYTIRTILEEQISNIVYFYQSNSFLLPSYQMSSFLLSPKFLFLSGHCFRTEIQSLTLSKLWIYIWYLTHQLHTVAKFGNKTMEYWCKNVDFWILLILSLHLIQLIKQITEKSVEFGNQLDVYKLLYLLYSIRLYKRNTKWQIEKSTRRLYTADFGVAVSPLSGLRSKRWGRSLSGTFGVNSIKFVLQIEYILNIGNCVA